MEKTAGTWDLQGKRMGKDWDMTQAGLEPRYPWAQQNTTSYLYGSFKTSYLPYRLIHTKSDIMGEKRKKNKTKQELFHIWMQAIITH